MAITSSFHPDEHTHIEPVRYGKGSNAMGLLRTLLIDGGGRGPAGPKFLGQAAGARGTACALLNLRDWSRADDHRAGHADPRQLDHASEPKRRSAAALTAGRATASRTRPGSPAAHEAVRHARRGDRAASPAARWRDLFNIPMTAHFLGGCAIGDSPEHGVIDPYHRVYGHPGLHIVDGSAVSANLGVNPSLTITAQAERAMAFWPNQRRGRPAPGARLAPTQRLSPVPPKNPVPSPPTPRRPAPARLAGLISRAR